MLGFIIVGMPRFAVAALTASPAPLITIMAIEGLACGPLNPITISITYELTPEHMRGRALGTMTATALVATPFGALAAGTLIDSLGLAATTAIFGGVYLLLTLIPAAFPVYRQMSWYSHPSRCSIMSAESAESRSRAGSYEEDGEGSATIGASARSAGAGADRPVTSRLAAGPEGLPVDNSAVSATEPPATSPRRAVRVLVEQAGEAAVALADVLVQAGLERVELAGALFLPAAVGVLLPGDGGVVALDGVQSQPRCREISRRPRPSARRLGTSSCLRRARSANFPADSGRPASAGGGASSPAAGRVGSARQEWWAATHFSTTHRASVTTGPLAPARCDQVKRIR
jgi:MFS family permease